MKKSLSLTLFVVMILGLNGCSCITKTPQRVWEASAETAKTMWGSSTRVLEGARVNALSKAYAHPSDEVFREIAKIAELQKWEIFMEDKKKGLIDVMGIPGAVNTTEVGIFVSAIKDNESKVEVVCLSTNTKRIAAETIFAELDKAWLAQADVKMDKSQ